MLKTIQDERGSVLIWTALFLGLFMAVAAVSLDFGFQRIQRARLQTAVDAAGLAAVQEADEYQDITVYGQYEDEHCTTDEDGGESCYRDWHPWSVDARRVLARDADTVARRRMDDAMGMISHTRYVYQGFSVSRRWAEIRPGREPEAAARAAYEANARRVAGAGQPRITRAGQDAVVVDAQAEHRTGLLGLFGIKRLGENVTGGAVAKPR